MKITVTLKQLTGQCSQHLVAVNGHQLNQSVVSDWLSLCSAAKGAGFNLSIASAHRSYARQLQIWNQKAQGLRPVLDVSEQPLAIDTLSSRELLFAMLRWSALPGASRHHWGTDIDVYDSAALPDGYTLKLTQTEVDSGGLLAPLHQWLDQCIAAEQAFGFYRPYCGQKSVAAERWHLSHKPASINFQSQLTAQSLYDFYQNNHEVSLRIEILANFDEIYANYICV